MSRFLRPFLLSLFALSTTAQAQSLSQSEIRSAWDAFVAGDHGQPLDLLMRAAEEGDAATQTLMGWAYETGTGVPRDTSEAIKWYQLSALQDHAEAYSSLGLLYFYGHDNLEVDYDVARTYYEVGITLDDPESYSFLGYMYQKGFGVDVDFIYAAELFQQGADLGDGYGAAQYGYMRREGLGIIEDQVEARQYYQLAIDAGYEKSYADLGHMLHRGLGGPVDLEEALNLYLTAIENDVPYGGIGSSYLILENPDLYPDPVVGLSLCFWAVANVGPDKLADYQDDCDYWRDDFTPAEIDRAYALSDNY